MEQGRPMTETQFLCLTRSRGIISELLALTDEAERKFKNARAWGFVDIFGGGLITDLIKHSQLGRASDVMNLIQQKLEHLRRELSSVESATDYSMNIGTFSTLADFLFDGIIADVYMQSKIHASLDQVRELRQRLTVLDEKLRSLGG